MHLRRHGRLAAAVVLLVTLAPPVWAQSARTSESPDTVSQELVGRWALVAVIVDGVDRTRHGVTQAGPVALFDLRADGTYTIGTNGSVAEHGTWSSDASVSPKNFDHARDVDGKPGPRVPGIYETDGDILKICMVAPSDSAQRPTAYEAKASNGSMIYILKREGT
jgi:uncharacterized protein (TIGR03067 family)